MDLSMDLQHSINMKVILYVNLLRVIVFEFFKHWTYVNCVPFSGIYSFMAHSQTK